MLAGLSRLSAGAHQLGSMLIARLGAAITSENKYERELREEYYERQRLRQEADAKRTTQRRRVANDANKRLAAKEKKERTRPAVVRLAASPDRSRRSSRSPSPAPGLRRRNAWPVPRVLSHSDTTTDAAVDDATTTPPSPPRRHAPSPYPLGPPPRGLREIIKEKAAELWKKVRDVKEERNRKKNMSDEEEQEEADKAAKLKQQQDELMHLLGWKQRLSVRTRRRLRMRPRQFCRADVERWINRRRRAGAKGVGGNGGYPPGYHW